MLNLSDGDRGHRLAAPKDSRACRARNAGEAL